MKRVPVAMAALAVALPAGADWQFGKPVEVMPATAGVFPHLEAAGRRSIAADGKVVAVVWEDNRSGAPQIYAAFGGSEGFSPALRLSSGGEAYEPAVTVAAEGFLFAWEQDGGVWMVTAGPAGTGAPVRVAENAAQVTLATAPDGTVHAVWVARAGRFGRVEVAEVSLVDGAKVKRVRPVEAQEPRDDQQYPALAAGPAGLTVAWEDRREGHTRLLYAREREGGFSGPAVLNDVREDRAARFGRGSGVTRVALAAGGDTLAAVWMDKRAFQGGYDTYAALAGAKGFGPNELVQDLFGENHPQWHPDIAVSSSGHVVAAWDDPRDGTPDVWFSWREADGWSSDQPLAAGPGAQTHPVLAFGPDGRLHAAWVDRAEEGRVRVLYAVGREAQ